MSTFDKKPYLKNYQRRLEDKFKDVCETAADICLHLQQIASKLEQKKQHLMNHNDADYFYKEYPKCCKELEAYDQTFFRIVSILSSLEDGSVPETDGDKDEKNKHFSNAENTSPNISEILYNPSESQKTSSAHASNDSPSTDSGIFFKLHSYGSDDSEKEKLHTTNSKVLTAVSHEINDESPTLSECTASASPTSENCKIAATSDVALEVSGEFVKPYSSHNQHKKKYSGHNQHETEYSSHNQNEMEYSGHNQQKQEYSGYNQHKQEYSGHNQHKQEYSGHNQHKQEYSGHNQHKKPSMPKVSKRACDDSFALPKNCNVFSSSASTVCTSENCRSTVSLDVQPEVSQESVSSCNTNQHARSSVCNGSRRICTDEESYISCNENNSSCLSSASNNSFISISSAACSQPTAKAKTIDWDIPALDIPVDSVIENGVIKNVQNPSDFWIQLEDHIFEERLLSSRLVKVELPTLKQLNYCLALFRPTGFYYRGKILSIYEGGREVRVRIFYIDCGIVTTLYADELRLLPDTLYNYPAQAIHCCLSGIGPTEEIWCREALEKFKDAVTYSDRNMRATVVSKEQDMFAVKLDISMKIEDESEWFDLGQMLCLMNLAVPTKTESTFVGYGMTAAASSVVSDLESDYENRNLQDQYPTSSQYGQETPVQKSPSIVHQPDSPQQETVESHAREEGLNVVGPSYYSELDSSDCLEETKYLNSDNAEHLECETGASDNEIYLSDDSEIEYASSSYLSPETSDNCTVEQNLLTSVPVENSNNANVDKSELSQNDPSECFYLDTVVPAPQPLFFQDDLMIVIPSVIYSPSYFYVNTSTGNPLDLDELRDQMTNFYENLECSSHLEIDVNAVKENMFFAYPYEDNCWYRVQINYICDKDTCDTPKAVALYIDYGNESIVNIRDLKPLMENFAKYPAMAVPCSLAFIVPKSTDSTVCNSDELPHLKYKWDKKATDKFLEITGDEKTLTAQVTKFCRLDGSRTLYEVCLWETVEGSDRLINDVLVEEGLADYSNIHIIPRLLKWKKSESNLHTADLSNWDPMAEDFHSVRNSYGVDVSDAEVATVGYKATDEKYVCKYYATTGWCYRGKKCPYEHIPSGSVDETVDQDPVYHYENGISLPEEDVYCLLQVSCVITAGHFFVVFPFGSASVDEIRNNPDISSANKNEFQELSSALTEHYSNAPFDENTVVALAYGSLVVAKTAFDGCWYRARIIEVQDVDKPVQVFYVDFGYTEWVDRRSIRQMQPQFLHCPFQAVEAFLANVEPLNYENGGKWTRKAKSAFEKLVAEETFTAYINKRTGNVIFVTLRKTSGGRNVVINDVLVQEGFAQISTSGSTMCIAKSKNQSTKKTEQLLLQPG